MNADGFGSTPLDHVKILQGLLRDRYQEGSIVKELVQNADDAGSSAVHLGWSGGLPIDHPLLSGPAVFAVNDGPFEDQHARAIRLIGTSSKTDQLGTIGKFGLGLKSIFHLGEVLFYFTSENQPTGGLSKAIIPWGAERRPDWAAFDDDVRTSIAHQLGPVLGSLCRWFAVWVPLRLDRHHRDGRLPIIKEMFDPYDGPSLGPRDRVFPAATLDQVGVGLPMLRSVERVSVWRASVAECQELLRLGAAGQPRCPRPVVDPEAAGRFSGVLRRSVRGGTTTEARYAGAAAVPDDPALSGLSGSEFWPEVVHEEDGREVARREKAPLHAAVCWQRHGSDSPTGTLRLSWGVFLPLSDASQPIRLDRPGTYSVLLHGGFIIDTGRRNFEIPDPLPGGPTSQAELSHAWNRALARAGTLPLVTEALAQFASRLTDPEVESITRGLASSPLFAEHRDALCERYAWAYRWQGGLFRWGLEPSGQEVWELPGPLDDPGLPGRVLPGLADEARRATLALHGRSRLCAKACADPWPAERVSCLLGRADTQEVSTNPAAAAYLDALLGLCKPALVDTRASGALLRLLRRVLGKLSLAQLAGNRASPFARLVAHVPAEQRLGLPFGQQFGENSPAERAWQALRELDLPTLVYPLPFDDLAGSGRGAGALDDSGLLAVLDRLAGVPAQMQFNPTEPRYRLALAAAESCPPAVRRVALDRCDQSLFTVEEVTPAGAIRPAALSAREVRARHAHRCVFESAKGSGAEPLALATRGGPITLVAPATGQALIGQGQVGPCDVARVLATLSRVDPPALAGPSDRLPLLEWLARQHVPAAEDRRWRQVVRFLLHGQPAATEDERPLWADAEDHDGLWSRLALAALDARGEAWRVVPGELARAVWGKAKQLCVGRIDEHEAARLVREAGPDRLSLAFSADQADRLLKAWEKDVDLLRRMPIHLSADPPDCPPQAITEVCFWQDGQPLPRTLLGRVTLLRPSDDALARAVQQRLAESWSARHVIEVALSDVDPVDHWEAILDALAALPTIPNGLLCSLRDFAWLPRAGGGAINPGSIIHLPRLMDEVARAVSGNDQGLADSTELTAAMRNHVSYAHLVAQVFPPTRDSLGLLALLLGEDAAWHLGPIGGRLASGRSVSDLLAALRGVPPEVLHAYPLIRRAYEEYQEECIHGLLPELCRPIGADRLQALLGFLRSGPGAAKERREVYRWYLRALAELDGGRPFRALVGSNEPLFLNRAGTWHPGRELCATGENLAPHFLLDQEQAKELGEELQKIDPTDTATGVAGEEELAAQGISDLAPAAKTLRVYFSRWVDDCPQLMPAIGGFLATLGDDPDILGLAKTWLGVNSSVEQVRLDLRLDLGRWKLEDVFRNHRVLVEIGGRDRSVEVPSLAGTTLRAELTDRPDDLFLRYFPSPLPSVPNSSGPWLRRMRLRDWRPGLDVIRAQRLLVQAALLVLQEFYNQSLRHDVRPVFDILKRQDLRDVWIVQQMVLEHAPNYLRTLDLGAQRRLQALIREADLATRRKHEARASTSQGTGQKATDLAEASRWEEDGRSRFREAFDDAAVCDLILAATRRTIAGHYQYRPDCVLFELFQNADDAAGELTAFGPIPPADSPVLSCAVEWFGGYVRFAHAGRPVNQMTRGSVTVSERGFERDLEKMLTLKTSDKSGDAEGEGFAPTGKFGIGFKSVYLIAAEPLVRSGPLGFRVRGGLYPIPLDEAERNRLAEEFARLFGRSLEEMQGTLIELPETHPADTELAVGRFRRLLPYLLAFSQYVRRCRVAIDGKGPKEVGWSPTPLPGVPGAWVGPLDDPDVTRALILELGPRCELLLGLDAEGIKPLPEAVPTLWVTAPTQECEKVGFALNAPFLLDTGRAQLTRDPRDNEGLARAAGRALGDRLVGLFDASQADWPAVRSALGLRADLTADRFWQSAWAVIADRFERATGDSDRQTPQVLRTVFWSDREHGACKFYALRAAVPTGLDATACRSPVRLAQVVGRVSGCLDDRSDLLGVAADWPELKALCDPARLVSERRIWRVLSSLVAGESPIRVTLAAIFQRRFDGPPSVITPDEAARWGQVVTAESLRKMEAEGIHVEVKEVREAIAKARFANAAGGESPVHELLLQSHPSPDHADERLRAAFAPRNRLLSPIYGVQAVGFFLACRTGGMEGRPQVLAEWARRADPDRRPAFLRYLLDGMQGRALGRWLVEHPGTGDWWRLETAFDVAASGLSPRDRDDARSLLRIGVPNLTLAWPPPPAPDVLQKIADWWQIERADRLKQYMRAVYPPFIRDALGENQALLLEARNLDDLDVRRLWLALFTLGMMHTLGLGGQSFGQHREFLELCHDEGWLDVFADGGSTSDEWMHVIDEFAPMAAGDPQYHFWMRQLFVGIRQVARWLPEYVEAFAQLRHPEVSLADVLRPRGSAVFQGGGVDAPAASGLLGAGACFVVRELARGGLLDARARWVRPWCYPPVRSVRRLLATLGCGDLETSADRWRASAIAFGFLEQHLGDPTFGGTFDIPLWLITRDPTLRQRFLVGDFDDAPDFDLE